MALDVARVAKMEDDGLCHLPSWLNYELVSGCLQSDGRSTGKE